MRGKGGQGEEGKAKIRPRRGQGTGKQGEAKVKVRRGQSAWKVRGSRGHGKKRAR